MKQIKLTMETSAYYNQLKKKIGRFIDPSVSDTPLEKWVDFIFILVICLNIMAVIMETDPAIGSNYQHYFRIFESFSIFIFTVEYILRIWTITYKQGYTHPIYGRLKYICSWGGLIDILSILPFYLHYSRILDLRIIRIFSLFRFLKIIRFKRYQEAAKIFKNVFVHKKEELLMCLLLTVMIIVVTSSLMYLAERHVQPDKFSSIPETMWWSVITLTTIGYGDVIPVTVFGKILTAIMSIAGIAILALPTGILASGLSSEFEKNKNPMPFICPHCGKVVEMK